jgi:hypothetical protein
VNNNSATRFMRKGGGSFWLTFAVTFLVLSTNALGQNSQPTAQNASTTTAPDSSSQTVLSSLANLPESDTLIYINSQRLLNEAVPKVMPEKDVANMRSAFNEIRQNAGIDPSKVDYIVIAVRFRKPLAELNFVPPEFMVVSRGDFSADSLMILAKAAAKDKLRDEKYGSKTLGVLTIGAIAKQTETNPLLRSFSEVAIVPLDANSIAVGTTGYLKAAVDAADGRGRISTESLNSLLRDPSALLSISGSPLTSFSKSFGLLGTETNARDSRCDSKFGDFYAAITMDATNFMLRGAMNADNPDTAKVIKSLLSNLLQQAAGSVPDRTAQSVLKTLSITPQDNEVVLRADIPQQMIIEFIREQMKPKQEVSAPVKTPVPAAKRRPAHRRTKPRK